MRTFIMITELIGVALIMFLASLMLYIMIASGRPFPKDNHLPPPADYQNSVASIHHEKS